MIEDVLEQHDIYGVPADPAVRARIRQAATEIAGGMDPRKAPTRTDLEACAHRLLQQLSLPLHYLGFSMVAVSNAFWRGHIAAIPYTRRLFLLPHCLSKTDTCRGTYDAAGLHCAGCGGCDIASMEAQAHALGYQVVVAEGTGVVVGQVIEGSADALIGVACLDSLEKSFARIVELGIPHLAIPLLSDGCRETCAEIGEVLQALALRQEGAGIATRSLLPLLRETRRLFEAESLDRLLTVGEEPPIFSAGHPLYATDTVAREWLAHGGKRLRPFITLTAYLAARHGLFGLSSGDDPAVLLPDPIRGIAVAIEALHKASLVHDDIEDDDAYRYGRPTLHRQYGLPPAINIGDYLVGLGYRLIAREARSVGDACVAEILGRLAAAHVSLCRGQGAELLWSCWQTGPLTPQDVLAIYAHKTAPAFEIALFAGIRAGGGRIDGALLARYATYLGEGFQVLNDLEDWRSDAENKVAYGGDLRVGRPTLLRTLAVERVGEEALHLLERLPVDERFAQTEALYRAHDVFTRAERLVTALHARALALAADAGTPALAELLAVLARMVLQVKTPAHRATE